MSRVSARDLGQALSFLREAEDLAGPDPFPTELLDRFRGLVGCDSVSYCELDRPNERVLLISECTRGLEIEASVDHEPIFWRVRHEHPVCAYQDRTGDFGARKLSDFLTQRQLRGLEIYRDLFRPYGVEYELDVGLPAPPRHTKVFLFARRDHDFGERERLLLDLLRPHLGALYAAARDRRVIAALQKCSDEPSWLVVAEPGGGIDFAGSGARELLRRYFGAEAERFLPDVMQAWLRSEVARLNGDGRLPPPDRPLTLERGDRRLVVRRVDDVLQLQEDVARLTGREQEVLDLVAAGLSNVEIGAVLWISPGTVRIHLQHAYAKLGVRSRTAALAALRDPGGASQVRF
jgi:DNA-binding CsgD family transcriptional regulator